MERSRIDSVALLGAALAAALVLLVARPDFGFLTTIGGLTLLLVLFAYDQEGRRSIFQSLAFSAVCGFCFMLMTGIVFEFSLDQSNAGLTGAAREAYFGIRLSVTWAFATLLLLAIDRARMSGRTTYEIPSTVRPERASSVQRQFVPEFTGPLQTTAAPAPVAAPAWAAAPPQTVAPPPPPVSAPTWAAAPPQAMAPPPPPAAAPAWTAPPQAVAPTPPSVAAPAWGAAPPPPPPAMAPQPQYYEPAPATIITAPPPAAPAAPAPEHAPFIPTAPSPQVPAPPPVRLPSGKEVMIYVNLVGEGLNVLRSVRAEHLGRDFYRIIEDTPEGETWEYVAGQVVRCKKKNLSSGKALVAYEEAPRSQ